MTNKGYTLATSLGVFVGEYIVRYYLPTLSIDMFQSKNIKEVSKEDTEEYEHIDSTMMANHHKNGGKYNHEEWNTYLTKRRELQIKYLPNELECNIPNLKGRDKTFVVKEDEMSDFKRGITLALWDSDICNYKCSTEEDIVIKVDDKDSPKLVDWRICIVLTLDTSITLMKSDNKSAFKG